MNETELIVCPIAREHIDAGEGALFAAQFDAERVSKALLQAWHGRVIWRLDGFNQDPVEIHSSPSVRKFFQDWHRERRHWLVFAALEGDHLRAMYLSLLKNANIVRSDCESLASVYLDPAELGQIVAKDLQVADVICAQLGFSPARRLKRAQEVMEYFGLWNRRSRS